MCVYIDIWGYIYIEREREICVCLFMPVAQVALFAYKELNIMYSCKCNHSDIHILASALECTGDIDLQSLTFSVQLIHSAFVNEVIIKYVHSNVNSVIFRI